MPHPITFTITVDGDDASIEMNKNRPQEYEAASDLTLKLAKELGEILERHKGKPHAHHDTVDHHHHHHA
jgi:hypothetical protein